MSMEKNYSGYKSFQYLEPGKDFEKFEFVKEINRVPSMEIKLSKEDEDRFKEILQNNIIISIHDHTFVLPEDLNQAKNYFRQNRIVTGYYGLSKSGLDAVFDGLLNSFDIINSNVPWKWDSIVYEIGMRLSDLSHQDYAIVGRKVDDIINAHKNGNIALIFHLESSSMIENDLDRIDILYGFGIRVMGLVYSESNMIGGGLKEKRDGGLTKFGYEVVERMNKIGMAIDLAHCGDQTSLDAIEASKVPVFITHAGSRTIWNTNRMKPDEVIQALAEKGGIIGIEAAPHTTISKKHPKHSLDSIMDHFQYIEKLVGIDHIAFGPDTLFGDHVGMHHIFARELGISEAQKMVSYEEVPYVDGIENPSEFKNIIRWLIKNGYSDEEIRKVSGENVLRVLRKIWIK
ncbi:MAG: membrane dipeptidase [Thermoplasmatales archaeon]